MSSPGPRAPRRARGLAARNALTLAALLPGVALLAWRGDATLLPRLATALATALLLEAACLRLRRQPLREFLAEGSAFLYAIVLVLWLPGLEGWRLVASVFVALVLARQAFGGLGANLFHPAMAGAAAAQVWLSMAVPAAAADAALAIAWLIGGLALQLLGIARWQAALGFAAGVVAATLLLGQPLPALLDPRWLFAALFVIPDPACGCEHPRTRALFGLTAGMLAVLAAPGSLAALPFAVLAANALAPALDAALAPRRAPGPAA